MMWITIKVDPDDPRLDTTGSKAECHRELVDEMYDRPPTVELMFDIEPVCNSFDGCEVIEFDYDALYEHLEKGLRDD